MLKTTSEVVVESMGCCVDVHADPKRHLSPEKCAMAMGACIDRNAPPLSRADGILESAPNIYFSNHNAAQGGSNRHARTSKGADSNTTSKVAKQEDERQAKFPFMTMT